MSSSNKIEMSFQNNTNVAWMRDQTDITTQVGMQTVATEPPSELQANNGFGVLEIDFNHDIIGHGIEENAFWCWNDGSWRFGLKIHVDFQLAGMGGSPQWYVMYDQNLNSSTINWVAQSGSAQATPYTFPSEIGYKIVCTPTVSKESLTLAVIMSNA